MMSKLPHRPGIYQLMNLRSGDTYIGCSNDMGLRITAHFGALRRKRHSSPLLQSAFDHDGETAFEASVLEECVNIRDLYQRELWYINHYHPTYNVPSPSQRIVLTPEAAQQFGEILARWQANTPEANWTASKLLSYLITGQYVREQIADGGRE